MPLYDTSIFVGHIRGNPKARWAIARLQSGAWSVAVSSVTVYELHFGCLLSKNPSEKQAVVKKYLAHVSAILPVDEDVAYRAAGIQAALRRRNQMMDSRDLFIAATALVHGLSLCPFDIEHFGRVSGLALEVFP